MHPLSFALAGGIAVFVIVLHEVITALGKMPRSGIPALSVLFIFVTVWAPIRLHDIAQNVWATPVPGSVPRGTTFDLAGIHALAIGVDAFLSLMLWFTWKRRSPFTVASTAVAVLSSAALSGVAMLQTVPRGGDEGTLLWFLLVPGAVLVWGGAILTAILTPILSVVGASRTHTRTSGPNVARGK